MGCLLTFWAKLQHFTQYVQQVHAHATSCGERPLITIVCGQQEFTLYFVITAIDCLKVNEAN